MSGYLVHLRHANTGAPVGPPRAASTISHARALAAAAVADTAPTASLVANELFAVARIPDAGGTIGPLANDTIVEVAPA